MHGPVGHVRIERLPGRFSPSARSWIKSRESGQLTVLKVELVEVHALHQVPQRLGLKRG